MTVLRELRIELPDHPGALAAVTRELAALGANIVEVAIHEVDGDRAVDEIVVFAGSTVEPAAFAEGVARAGAMLLSLRECVSRVDAVVAALTWVSAALERPRDRQVLRRAAEALTGVTPVVVVPADLASTYDVTAAALRRGRTAVQRVEALPAFVASDARTGHWLLAAPERQMGEFVLVATRPFSTRFTATEIRRLTALLDAYRTLSQSLATT